MRSTGTLAVLLGLGICSIATVAAAQTAPQAQPIQPIQPVAPQPGAQPGAAEPGPRPRPAVAPAAPRRLVRPVPYCWHFSGWNGAGWYRCGYAQRAGYGWGGGYGWQGWPAPVARVERPRRPIRIRLQEVAPGYPPVASYTRDYGRFAPPPF